VIQSISLQHRLRSIRRHRARSSAFTMAGAAAWALGLGALLVIVTGGVVSFH
jgi:hypothetical protein